MREVRGNRISMIFQEPMTSLNPVFTVGDQIGESLRLHAGLDAGAARAARDRDAAAGRHPGARAARRRVPAPALGRHAPARDDRDGAGLPARHPDRRRAHHRARRDGAGADLRPAARPAAREGHGHPADHARHGRGGRDGRPRDGDVRGPRDRAGHDRAGAARARPSVHARADRLPARARQQRSAADARQELAEIAGVVPSIWELGSGCAFRERCPHAMAALRASRCRRCSRSRRRSRSGQRMAPPAGCMREAPKEAAHEHSSSDRHAALGRRPQGPLPARRQGWFKHARSREGGRRRVLRRSAAAARSRWSANRAPARPPPRWR